MRILSILFVLGALLWALVPADALAQGAPGFQAGAPPGNTLGATSDAEFWRQVRQGRLGMVSIPDPYAAVLVRSEGDNWRALRNGPISYYGGWLLIVALLSILGFFLWRGRIKIEGGRSGREIPRFTLTERLIHWYVACVFILLAISGMVLLFGKYVLMPVVGKAAFGHIANACLQGHNLFGPMFIFGIVAMFLVYVRDNTLNGVDWNWIKRGGVLAKGHVSSEKNNFGEKVWFWMAVGGGLVLSTTGLAMEFPWIPTIIQVQWANLLHATAAIGLVAVALGHIYIGTLGMEGALEGMTRGTVDENWAMEHHDLWAKQVMDDLNVSDGRRLPPEPAAGGPGGGSKDGAPQGAPAE
ncbi:MAG: formate dehydrogenase subunit gamma [Rhodobacterales bacterium]|nr:formate dehydrogenase subunit gamma [Rhodobacterales bacterium]